jgi:NAD(P)-dependent dehydrogenase (short-subunit alcohol dehydrogenase family)
VTGIQERRAIVTGAGGEIGAAVARRFAREGARLALFDRKVELLDGIVEECRALGASVAPVAADQSDRRSVESAVANATEHLGGVDSLFANAGYGQFASFLDVTEGAWQRHVDVNLSGTFHVCQVVAREMVRQGTGGAIVVNTSSGARQYTTLLPAYCATKAALGMLVQAMAAELGPFDIRVNGVMPGVIETGMTAPMLNSGDEQRDYLVRHTPAGRLGRPDDVAATVLFLSSSDAGFVTGHSVAVDGGQTVLGQPQWYVNDFGVRHDTNWTAAS